MTERKKLTLSELQSRQIVRDLLHMAEEYQISGEEEEEQLTECLCNAWFIGRIWLGDAGFQKFVNEAMPHLAAPVGDIVELMSAVQGAIRRAH